MPNPPRNDEPGAWHHVMNRGIARRTVFEGREDIRYFLSCVAGAVRRGQLELHAFAVLATYFHMLVRSPIGELSESMKWIEHQYVRWFNRRRRRDGALFRGRFLSRRVTSSAYWQTLLHYIDSNPVAARLASRPTDYPWCSAWHYARLRGPPWLTRREVEEMTSESMGRDRFDPADYRARATAHVSESVEWIVERRRR